MISSAARLSANRRLETLLKLSQMTEDNLEQIAAFVLEQAARFTTSQAAYLAFTNGNESQLHVYTWPQSDVQHRPACEPVTLDSQGEDPVWREALQQHRPVIENDCSPACRALHIDHQTQIPLSRFLTIPVIADGRTLALLTVGNKPQGYDGADLEQVNSLADGLRRVLQHKRTLDALRDREARYQTFMENTTEGIWRFELDEPVPIDLPVEDQIERLSRYAYVDECNDVMARLHGFKQAADVLKKHIHELYSPDWGPYRDFVGNFVRRGYNLSSVETRRKDASGREHVFLNSLYGVLDQGRLVRAWGSRLEVTERRRADRVQSATYRIAQAAVSAENLQDLFHSIHVILGELMPADNFFIALFDPQTQTLSFPYFVDQYDAPPSPKKLDKGLTEYILRTGKPLLASPEVFEELVEQEEVLIVGAPSIDWMGVPLIARNRVIGVMATQSYTEGVRFDVDEMDIMQFVSSQVAMAIDRKQAADVLRLSEARYRAIVEDQTELICRWLPDGTFTFVNEAYCRYTGKTREELVGTKFTPLVQEGNPEQGLHALIEAGGENHTRPYEVRVVYPNGTVQWEQWIVRPIFAADGHLVEFQSVGQNITERKQREYELEAISSVSLALRKASNRIEMMPVILDQLIDLVHADGASIAMVDVFNEELVFELGRGDWDYLTGTRLPLGEDLPGYVMATGQPYLNNNMLQDPHLTRSELVDGLSASACAPLIAQGQTIGVIWIGKRGVFDNRDLSLLIAIGDIAASAIFRSTLFEQTQRRLQRLTALRAIDMAVSASLDVHVTLNILLDQVTVQLGIHAADVLLHNTHNQTLEFAAGRGFYSSGFQNPYLRIGQGLAGKAAIERTIVNVSGSDALKEAGLQDRLAAGENFVAYSAVPLIAKGQVKGVLELFYRAPMTAEPEWLDFLGSLGASAAIAIDNAELLDKLQRSNVELSVAYEATIEGWSHALELRDHETEGHTQRVTDLTLRLARKLGVDESDMIHLHRGALLHDIGKMAIPDSILLKNGALTEDEWEIMRKHPIYAYQLLSPIPYLRPALEIPYYHHERWDGKGYPFGLHAEQIPLAARIFAVVDVWDALLSDRPYRMAWPVEQTRDYLRVQAGIAFDPDIVPAFLELTALENLQDR